MNRAVVCIRMSSHGDIIMLGRTLERLRAAGFEPVVLTHAAALGAAQCLVPLRHVWTLDDQGNEEPTHWYREHAQATWVREPLLFGGLGDTPPAAASSALQAAATRELVAGVLDFQVTARSQKALRTLRRRCGLRAQWTLRCRKDRLQRLSMLARARWNPVGQASKREQHPAAGGTPQDTLPLWQRRSGDSRVLERYDELTERFLQLCHRTESAPHTEPHKPLVSESAGVTLQPTYDCVIFAGASLPLKAWPPAQAISCARHLIAKGLSVAFAGGPSEAAGARTMAEACPGAVSLAGALPLANTIDLVVRARFVVTTDSFPGHVRDLSGGPCLVLFGATSPQLGFAPRGTHVTLASRELGCSPCTRHGRGTCRFANHACMSGLSGEAVAKHVLESLKMV